MAYVLGNVKFSGYILLMSCYNDLTKLNYTSVVTYQT